MNRKIMMTLICMETVMQTEGGRKAGPVADAAACLPDPCLAWKVTLSHQQATVRYIYVHDYSMLGEQPYRLPACMPGEAHVFGDRAYRGTMDPDQH